MPVRGVSSQLDKDSDLTSPFNKKLREHRSAVYMAVAVPVRSHLQAISMHRDAARVRISMWKANHDGKDHHALEDSQRR
jgi:hypothetical protein